MSQSIKHTLTRLGQPTPKELFDAAVASGVRIDGHPKMEAALRRLCVTTTLHIGRLRHVFLNGGDPDSIPAKENVLLIGPSGSGKTHLAKAVFQRVLGLPCVVEDISTCTSSGYVGRDVPGLLARLIDDAEGDVELAGIGILVLDEIDKIAGVRSRRRDVKGDVAGELLRVVEGGPCLASFRSGYAGPSGDQRGDVTLDTSHLLTVGCGAFDGVERIVARRQSDVPIPFGFRPVVVDNDDPDACENITIDDLIRYGMLAELMGRFSHVVPLPRPPVEFLKRLARDEINRRAKLWQGMGAEITDELLSDGFVEQVIELASRRPTGARAIPSVVAELMTERAYSALSAVAVAPELTSHAGNGDIPTVGNTPSHLNYKVKTVVFSRYNTVFEFAILVDEETGLMGHIDMITVKPSWNLHCRLAYVNKERLKRILAEEQVEFVDYQIAEQTVILRVMPSCHCPPQDWVRRLHKVLVPLK